MTKQPSENSALAMGRVVLFQEQTIRRLWHENAWWFSVVDVCAVLTGSVDAGAYWRKLKQRMVAEAGQPVTFCHGLKLTAPDGKQRLTDCANTEGLFRIIQSIHDGRTRRTHRRAEGARRAGKSRGPRLGSPPARTSSSRVWAKGRGRMSPSKIGGRRMRATCWLKAPGDNHHAAQ